MFFFIVLIKRIGKTKNRMKSDLETTIKIIDSKQVKKIAIESADSKRKK